MPRFRTKPVVVEALTFDQLVEHGRASGVPLVAGVPWSFNFMGHPITHENDGLYLIAAPGGSYCIERGQLLVVKENGDACIYSAETFAAKFEPADHADCVPELVAALDEIVKLQAHYAGLLNQYDGGERIVFGSAREWVERLRECRLLGTVAPLAASGE